MFLKSILILTLSYYTRCFDLFIEKRELSNIFIGSNNSKIKEEGPAVFLVKENKVNEVLTSSVMKNILVPLSPAVKRVRLKVRRPQHDLSLTSHITSLNQFVLKHPSIKRSVIEETKTATFEELTINFVCNTITNKLTIVDIVFNFTLQSHKYFDLKTRTGSFTYRKQCGNTVQTNLLANNVNATVKMSTGKINVNLRINVLTGALLTVLAVVMCLVVFYFVRRSLCQTKLQNPSNSFSFKSEAPLLPRVQKSSMKTKPKPPREIPKLKVPSTATNFNGLETSVEIREVKTRRDTSLIVVAKPNSLPAIVEETA